MAQLVGQNCVLCNQRIESAVEAKHCESCHSPIHLECVRVEHTTSARVCNTCGAPADAALSGLREDARMRAASQDRKRGDLLFVVSPFAIGYGVFRLATAALQDKPIETYRALEIGVLIVGGMACMALAIRLRSQ